MKYFEPSLAALRLVPKIVQTGRLTQAASELHISQSAASHALSSLESQLGSRLFVREHEGLRLSEAGQRLLPLIEDALSTIERIRAEAVGLSAFETGNLRVAAVPSLLSTILPPILREYGARYPGIELSIFEGTDDEVHAWIKSGVTHVGFAALPIEGVEAEEVARDEWLALVPATGLQDRTSITLKELAKNKFLMSGGGCERHIQGIFALSKRRYSRNDDGEGNVDHSCDGRRMPWCQSDSSTIVRKFWCLQNFAVETAPLSADRHDSVDKPHRYPPDCGLGKVDSSKTEGIKDSSIHGFGQVNWIADIYPRDIN